MSATSWNRWSRPISRPQATHEILVDDERVRVTRWEFVPGAETGWHHHELDYVVTPVTDCAFQLEEPGGMLRHVDMKAGAAYGREAGVEHNVINGGTAEMSFVEVELKS